ncbi:YadA-like family protein [Photobacterium swingsii]|uniref:YadA-like family protein n=1 Tax=Photobacterium swingsii TaxID=680026 RepID=UPI004068827B
MKKTVIALSMLAAFGSTSVMASDASLYEIKEMIHQQIDLGNEVVLESKHNKLVVNQANMDKVMAEVAAMKAEDKTAIAKLYNDAYKKGEIKVSEDANFTHGHNNTIAEDTSSKNDKDNHDYARAEAIASEVDKAIASGSKVSIDGHVISRANIEDVAKVYHEMSDEERIDASKYVQDAIINGKVKVESDGVRPDDVVIPDHIEIERNKAKIEELYKQADAVTKYAIDEATKEYTAAAKHVAKQDARISTLEQDFSKMAERQDALEKRVDKVEKKMDSVMAGVHAVTNARPFVQNGQTAVGVGTGFAGSAQSVAIGAAHSFDDSAWSMSASMNVTTGSGVKTDVSGGVGAHYVF